MHAVQRGDGNMVSVEPSHTADLVGCINQAQSPTQAARITAETPATPPPPKLASIFPAISYECMLKESD